MMPIIQRDNFNLSYEVTCDGDGPTLVLVPGLGEQIGTVEFPVEHCEYYAARIDNADLWLDPGMGHTMHEEMWPEMASRMASLAGL